MEFLNGKEPHFSTELPSTCYNFQSDPLAPTHPTALFASAELMLTDTFGSRESWHLTQYPQHLNREAHSQPPVVSESLLRNLQLDPARYPRDYNLTTQTQGRGERSKGKGEREHSNLYPFPLPLSPKQTLVEGSAKLALESIQTFFQRDDYLTQLQLAYGSDLTADTVTSAVAKIHSLPQLELLPAATLGTADGAFDGLNNKIYLSTNLIDRGDTAEISGVIIEEIGHYLDRQFHGNIDAPGDEGEIFSKLVRNIPISPRPISNPPARRRLGANYP